MEKIDLENFIFQYTFEDIDSAEDLVHLAETAVKKIKSLVGLRDARFFVHHAVSKDYREVLQEGLIGIPEDTLFISYLSMHQAIIPSDELLHESVFDENDLVKRILVQELKASYFVPLVYNYRLLGFVILVMDGEMVLDDGQVEFIKHLTETLHINLYAAIQVDAKLQEYMTLTDIASQLKDCKSYDEIAESVLDIVGSMIPFSDAVYYEYDEFQEQLIPRIARPEMPLDNLHTGESVSGFVFKKQNPVLISDISDSVHYAAINKEKFIDKSFLSIPLVSSKHAFGVITLADHNANRAFSSGHLYLAKILSSLLINEMTNKILYRQLEKSYLDTIITLSKTLEAKDPYTMGHSERVMRYSVGIANQLKLSEDTVLEIKYASMLHDIGKIGVSDLIINKTESLSPEEFSFIKKHTTIGADIVDSVQFLRVVKDLVKYHHEKIDGTGYHGKKLGEYPWEAMIISIADIFDALTSNRAYRQACDHETAFSYIYSLKGIQFEERFVDAFKEYLISEKMIKKDFRPIENPIVDHKLDDLEKD